MSDVKFTGAVSGDLNVAGNYSPSGVPIAGDTIIFDGSTNPADTSMATFNLIDTITVIVTPNQTKAIGTSGNPLQVQDAAKLFYNGPNCPQCYYAPNTCTEAHVLATMGAGGNASLVLQSGAITSLFVSQASKLSIDGTVTTGYFGSGDIVATLESGGTITTAYIAGGKYTANGTITTCDMHGGEVVYQGASKNITALNLKAPGVIFRWNAASSTITKINAYAGLFDATTDLNTKTITNMDIHFGATVDLRCGANVITASNAPNLYGGILEVGNNAITFTTSIAPPRKA